MKKGPKATSVVDGCNNSLCDVLGGSRLRVSGLGGLFLRWELGRRKFFTCDLMLVGLKLILLSRQLNSAFKCLFCFSVVGFVLVALVSGLCECRRVVSCDLMWERRVRDGYFLAKWRKNYDSQQLLDVDVNFTCGSLGLVYLWIGKIEVREVRSAQKEVEREWKHLKRQPSTLHTHSVKW